MKLRNLYIIASLAALASYGGYLAWRAHRNLVTLHEHNVPFEKVMGKVAWQTWEKFEWHKNVKGNVTIDVDNMPLESALEIIGEQVSARATTVYPLYKKKAALASLDKALKGEIDFKQSSFTNWQGRAGGFRAFGPGGMDPSNGGSPARADGVSLVFSNKDLVIASMALSRVGRAQVIPENGQTRKLNLTLAGESFESAVKKVAKVAAVSWTKLYVFEPARGGFMAGAGGPNGERSAHGRNENSAELREQNKKRMEEVLETLPPEEQEKAKENREVAQVMRDLPQEARQQVMSERMNSPEMQQRMDQRSTAGIKNSTPEQRRDRFERVYQMRQARAAGLSVAGPNRNR
jgi:hypothetical protein